MLNSLGEVLRMLGEYAGATDAYSESLALYQGLGDRSGIELLHTNLGYLAYNQGDLAQADAQLRDGLVSAYENANHFVMVWCLVGLGLVALAQQQADRATRLWRVCRDQLGRGSDDCG